MKRIFVISFLALLTAVYLVMYFSLDDSTFRICSIYALVLIGLYFSYTVPYTIVILNGIGLILLFSTYASNWGGYSWGLSFMLSATAAIPFYYRREEYLEKHNFDERYFPKLEELSRLKDKVTVMKDILNTHESEIEKINRLYVLGRELVEHMDTDAVVEHLQRILLNRPGVRSLAIFSWEKSNWKALYFSNQDYKDRWLEFIHDHKYLTMEKNPCIVPSPGWLDRNSFVFWPVRMGNDLLASILLVTDIDAAPRYIEEGAIFLPQIALGLIRTRLFAEVTERSRNDGLTGLYRRSYFIERFQSEIKRAERYKTVFSLLMLDIDHFKKVNDTYGHLTGDDVLRILAEIFKKHVRPGDLIGRYGGEEFLILLHMVSPDETLKIANTIKCAVSEHEFYAKDVKFNITISTGISRYPSDGITSEELLSAADHALYWVKASGRNGIKEFSFLK